MQLSDSADLSVNPSNLGRPLDRYWELLSHWAFKLCVDPICLQRL